MGVGKGRDARGAHARASPTCIVPHRKSTTPTRLGGRQRRTTGPGPGQEEAAGGGGEQDRGTWDGSVSSSAGARGGDTTQLPDRSASRPPTSFDVPQWVSELVLLADLRVVSSPGDLIIGAQDCSPQLTSHAWWDWDSVGRSRVFKYYKQAALFGEPTNPKCWCVSRTSVIRTAQRSAASTLRASEQCVWQGKPRLGDSRASTPAPELTEPGLPISKLDNDFDYPKSI
jgi:hypothetical protein